MTFTVIHSVDLWAIFAAAAVAVIGFNVTGSIIFPLSEMIENQVRNGWEHFKTWLGNRLNRNKP